MDKCWVCYGGIVDCVCDKAANDNARNSAEFITLPMIEVLGQQSSLHRLAISYKAMGLPRRAILNFINDQLIEYRGIVVDENGRLIDVLDIDVDHTFRTDNDPSERWISAFLNHSIRQPVRQAQLRITPRLQLLWLALAIRFPKQADAVIH